MASKHGAQAVASAVKALLLSALLTAAFVPRHVRAEATHAEREIARSAMRAGDELRAAGDLATALQRYRSAHAIMHVPTTGLAVAQTEAALNMLLEARTTAIEVVNLPGEGQEPARFKKARRAAAELAAQLAPRIPSILLEVSPEGAPYRIAIDGVALPDAARHLPLKANPGIHSLEVTADGYQAQLRELSLAEAETARFVFELAPVELVRVPVVEPPKAISHTPERPHPARSAPVEVSVRAPAGSAGNTRAWIGLAGGGVLVLAGAGAGIVSAIKTDQLRTGCDESFCGEARSGALSTANTLANVANISIPLGLLAMGYGMYELLSSQRSEPREPGERSARAGVRWTSAQSIGVFW